MQRDDDENDTLTQVWDLEKGASAVEPEAFGVMGISTEMGARKD
jgi:hypothetical protein